MLSTVLPASIRRLATVLLALWLTACGAFEQGPEEGDASPPAKVEIAEARPGSLLDTWTVLGDVQPLQRAELAAGASGPVVRVAVREGDAVEPGQVLLEVDTDLIGARLASAEAAARQGRVDLEQARSDLVRVEQVESDVLAPSEVEQARSRVAALEAAQAGLDAAVRQARAELSRHRVRTPFAAVVAARHVDPGDWVTPGQPVLDVVQVAGVEIHVHVPPELVRQVREGDTVQLAASPQVEGTVVGRVPALDPVQRTALIRVAPASGASLIPGTPVDVTFDVTRSADDAVLVPRDALVLGPIENRVVRVVDQSAEVITVEVLGTNDDAALVRGGELASGDVVVVRGNERLRPGQSVDVTSRRGWTED